MERNEIRGGKVVVGGEVTGSEMMEGKGGSEEGAGSSALCTAAAVLGGPFSLRNMPKDRYLRKIPKE